MAPEEKPIDNENYPDDTKESAFRLKINPLEDPVCAHLATLPSRVRDEQKLFAPAAERLAQDAEFSHKIKNALEKAVWAPLQDEQSERGTTSNISFSAIDVDGVLVPIARKQTHPLRDDMQQREEITIKNWQERHPVSFFQNSALQTPRADGLWMINLKKLGYMKADEVLTHTNVFTHPGRLFMLRYFTHAATWMADMETFCVPIDTFPKGDAVWFKEKPTGLWDMRTIDYNAFDLLTSSNDSAHYVQKIWFGSPGEHRKWGALWRVPSLLPVVYGAENNAASQDPALKRLDLYTSLATIERNPNNWGHAVLRDTLHKALSLYEADTSLHTSNLLYNATSTGLAWHQTLTALEQIVPVAERKQIVTDIVARGLRDSSDNPEMPLYRLIGRLSEPNDDIIARLANKCQCSLRNAAQLVDNIPLLARAKLLERWGG